MLDGVPPLNQLYFYLTEGCNLACRHCWLAPKFDPDASRYPTLPLARFEATLAEAKPLGLSGVKLTGGEPLLHPGIAGLLEVVRREELGLTVETNGVLVTAELAAAIAACPRPFVSVSLDGATAAVHEAIRGVAGSFEAAVAGLRRLVEAGLRPQVICSLMRENVGEIEAVIALAERLGAASVKFNIIQPTARGELVHDRGNALGLEELIGLGRWVESELAAATPVRLYFDFPMAFRPLSRLAEPGGCGQCGILGILGVLATGQYALCGIGETVPELIFGRAGEVPLATVWRETAMLQALRDGLPSRLEGICGQCLMAPRCLGSCVAQNYYRSRALFAPFWFCAEAERGGLFPESRRRPAARAL